MVALGGGINIGGLAGLGGDRDGETGRVCRRREVAARGGRPRRGSATRGCGPVRPAGGRPEAVVSDEVQGGR